jgi:hypothetical protein
MSTGPKQGKTRKPYEKPTATRLTSGEAKLKLVDHDSRCNQAAKDFLEMMFPQGAKNYQPNKKRSA